MREVIFFQRNKAAGYSIGKVSQPIIDNIKPQENYCVPCRGASVKDLLKNLFFIFKRRKREAIHHITGDIHYGILSLIGVRTVLTVHDTVTLDFNVKKNSSFYLKKLLWYTLPLKFADRIVCISEVSKQYLQKYTSRKDIAVIHNAVDSRISLHSPRNIDSPFRFLVIGTKSNKNLERTIEALNGLECNLTVIGKLNDIQKQLIDKYNINCINKSNLSDDELCQEYYHCDAVLFCSLFEGFGMPVLEANKAGRPIICSNIPVLKEVAGDAAYFVDPYDVLSIRNGCINLIKDKELRTRLISNGIINAQNHDIKNIIKQWNNLYSSLD